MNGRTRRHGHSLLVVLSGSGWMLVRTAVSKRTVSSKKGLACWLIRSYPKAVFSLQKFVEGEAIVWCHGRCHGWMDEELTRSGI